MEYRDGYFTRLKSQMEDMHKLQVGLHCICKTHHSKLLITIAVAHLGCQHAVSHGFVEACVA